MFDDETTTDTAAPALPPPTATVTLDQVVDAMTSGRWTHDVPGTELWLNTSFSPVGRELDAFVVELQAYGIAVG